MTARISPFDTSEIIFRSKGCAAMIRIVSCVLVVATALFTISFSLPAAWPQQHAAPVAPKPATASAAAPDALLAELLSPKPDVQKAALDSLVKLDKLSKLRLIPRLIKELDNPDFDHYYGAIVALGNVGPAALPALTKVMQGEGDARRRYAAMAIGMMGQKAESVVPVFVTCLSDKDLDLRLIVADELPNLGPAAKAAVPTLITGTRDENVYFRLAAIKALGEIGPGAEPAIPFLIDALKEGVYGSDDALGGIGAAAVPALLAVFKSSKDKALLDRATSAFTDMGPQAAPAVPELIAALKNKDTRLGAISALQAIGPAAKDGVPALIAILNGSPEYSNAPPEGYEYVLDKNTNSKFVEEMGDMFDQGSAAAALKKIATPEALAAEKAYDDREAAKKK
jgi:HEAT repeat protein